MISRRTAEGDDHRPINACLRLLVAVADCRVTTVEGIGNLQDGLDPVQDRIARCNGTQCGYCTPGFVMNAHACLRHNQCFRLMANRPDQSRYRGRPSRRRQT
jgi:aerobic-type carbon monoxide dehydrogenase small subunit (CoxS/CutS family)